MRKIIDEIEGVPVSLTEQMVLNPAVFPEPIRTWRFYRIEYGGPNECCFREDSILLPPQADPYVFDLLFEFWQTPEEDWKRQGDILGEIFNILLGLR